MRMGASERGQGAREGGEGGQRQALPFKLCLLDPPAGALGWQARPRWANVRPRPGVCECTQGCRSQPPCPKPRVPSSETHLFENPHLFRNRSVPSQNGADGAGDHHSGCRTPAAEKDRQVTVSRVAAAGSPDASRTARPQSSHRGPLSTFVPAISRALPTQLSGFPR